MHTQNKLLHKTFTFQKSKQVVLPLSVIRYLFEATEISENITLVDKVNLSSSSTYKEWLAGAGRVRLPIWVLEAGAVTSQKTLLQ